MGQYFRICLEKDGVKTISDELNNDKGSIAKIVESSSMDNNFIQTVCSMINSNPMRVTWMGAYAAKTDFYNTIWEKDLEVALDFHSFDYTHTFLVNHSKKQFIDMDWYKSQLQYSGKCDNDWYLHPLPLLTAIGNDEGGYWGSDMNLVGIWARDLISIEQNIPTDYTQITPLFHVHVLCESKSFIVYNTYEQVYLYSKQKKQTTVIGDFYGDVEDAAITPDEKYCVMAGSGMIIYRLSEPFNPYKYNTIKEQWTEYFRKPPVDFIGIVEISNETVWLKTEDGSYYEVTLVPAHECPECNGTLYNIVQGLTLTCSCMSCDFEVYTTYQGAFYDDGSTHYNIYLEKDNDTTKDLLKLVSKLIGGNYISAKNLILHPDKPIFSGTAYDVVEVQEKLDEIQALYRIEPPFTLKKPLWKFSANIKKPSKVRDKWPYKNHSENEYWQTINHLYKIAEQLGATYIKTVDENFTTCNSSFIIKDAKKMKIYKFKDEYFWIETHFLADCPFIVFSFGDSIESIFDDAEPFPYNLSEEELVQEVKYSLGIDEYPD